MLDASAKVTGTWKIHLCICLEFIFMLSVRIVLSEMKCLCFVLPMQMPFILPLNYTKCSVGRADVHQLQKNKLTEKEKKSRGRAGHFSCQVTLVWDNLLHFVSADKDRQRIPTGTLPWTPPRPSLGPSAHQSPTSPGPEEHRGTMTGRKLQIQRRGQQVQDCLRKTSVPESRYETHQVNARALFGGIWICVWWSVPAAGSAGIQKWLLGRFCVNIHTCAW